MSLADLQSYHDFACALARDAGAIAKEYFSTEITFINKSDNSPVTAADTEINSLVISRCSAAFPEINILGEEESSYNGSRKDFLWVCDPIDGTIPYTLGMPISTFSLALVQDGEPVIGVIYDFHSDRLFSAIKGKGAWLNGKVLPLASEKEPLKLVNLEWYPSAAHNLTGSRERLFAQRFQVPNYATNLFVSTSVALGRAAATVYAGDRPWDAAAAKVIAEACGCIVTDLRGANQRYDQSITGVIVAHPKYHKLVLEAITVTTS